MPDANKEMTLNQVSVFLASLKLLCLLLSTSKLVLTLAETLAVTLALTLALI